MSLLNMNPCLNPSIQLTRQQRGASLIWPYLALAIFFSMFAERASAVPDGPILTAPAQTGTTITLSWAPVSSAIDYHVAFSPCPRKYGDWTCAVMGNPVTTATSMTISGLTAGTTYYFAAYAKVSTGANSTSLSGMTEFSFATAATAATSSNVALSNAGGVASASSTYNTSYPVAAINNDERRGYIWSKGGGWNDATKSAYPDWVQIDFGGPKTIDHVVVFTLQDNITSPVEPTDTMTFTKQGIKNFTVQGWNGSSWVTLGTVVSNTLVKRTVNLPAVQTDGIVPYPAYYTDRIRVNVTSGLNYYSRITEVEAWTAP